MANMPLAGNHRQAMVAQLVDRFDRVKATGETQVICIMGDQGWGKTRIVQEFYGVLASERQPKPHYWPPSLIEEADEHGVLQGWKTIYPKKLAVPAGGRIPWMWWALRGGRGDGEELTPATLVAGEQFKEHLAPIANRLAARKELRREGLALLGALSSIWIPDAIAIANSSRRMAKAARSYFSAGYNDSLSQGIQRIAVGVDPDAEVVAETLSAIAGIFSRDLPLILVVDDAHWADPTTVELVGGLAESKLPVIVVALAWPSEVRSQAVRNDSEASFGSWLATAAGTQQRVEIWRLQRLNDAEMREIVTSFAPATRTATVAELARRADGNPLALQLMLSSDRIKSSLQGQAIMLEPEAVAEIPAGLWDQFRERFRGLPRSVRRVVVVAADQGQSFLRSSVLASAAAVLGAEAQVGFARAVSPNGWFRHQVDALFRFSENILFEVAESELSTLTPEEIEETRDRATAAVRSLLEEWGDRPPIARWSALNLHVRLSARGYESDWNAAARSAAELAEFERRIFNVRRAESLIRTACRWLEDLGPAADAETRVACDLTLARVAAAQGRFGEARALRLRALERFEGGAGTDDAVLQRIRQDVARSLASGTLQEQREALEMRKEIDASIVSRYGAEHADSIEAKQELAMSFSLLGDQRSALEVREAVVAQLEEGDLGSPSHIRSLTNLSYTYSRLGRNEEALQMRRRVVAMRRENLGEWHPSMAVSLVNLAASLRRAPEGVSFDEQLEQLRESVSCAERAVKIRRSAVGVDHHRTLTAEASLAKSLFELGKLLRSAAASGSTDDLSDGDLVALAHSLMESVAERRRTRFSMFNRRTIESWVRLAEIREYVGDRAGAVDAAESALEGAVNVLEPGHELRLRAERRLAILRRE